MKLDHRKSTEPIHVQRLLRAFVLGGVVWIAFQFIGKVFGPALGPGWIDILQGGGGLVALIVVALVAFGGRRKARSD